MSFLSRHEVESIFGSFEYREGVKGAITITDMDWLKNRLTTIQPPFPLFTPGGKRVFGFLCHKLIAPSLLGVFRDVETHGLIAEFGTWDGCWVPRHVLHDPKKPLSLHSWAVAWDCGASKFPYGSKLKRCTKLIAIANDHGFMWGGEFKKTPDPMHFEAGGYFRRFKP